MPRSWTPADENGDGDAAVVELAPGERRRLVLPAQATETEASALVAAIAAHLRDRESDGAEEEDPEVDRWTLAARLGARSRRDLPRSCRRGHEWAAAARRR